MHDTYSDTIRIMLSINSYILYFMVRNNDKHTCHLIYIINIASHVIFNRGGGGKGSTT